MPSTLAASEMTVAGQSEVKRVWKWAMSANCRSGGRVWTGERHKTRTAVYMRARPAREGRFARSTATLGAWGRAGGLHGSSHCRAASAGQQDAGSEGAGAHAHVGRWRARAGAEGARLEGAHHGRTVWKQGRAALFVISIALPKIDRLDQAAYSWIVAPK